MVHLMPKLQHTAALDKPPLNAATRIQSFADNSEHPPAIRSHRLLAAKPATTRSCIKAL